METHHSRTKVRADLEADGTNGALIRKWAEWLLQDATLATSEEAQAHLKRKDVTQVPQEVLAKAKDAESLVCEIYPNLDHEHSREDSRDTVILAPTSKTVNLLNEFALARIRRKVQLCYNEDSVADQDDETKFTDVVFNGLNPTGFAKSRLQFKEGIPVVVLRNLAPIQEICNGTRLVVEHVVKFAVRARILNRPEKFKNNSFYVPRTPLFNEPGYYSALELVRKQLTVRLAYAMTVNKSQGQMFKRGGLYLSTPVFSHGQLYVTFLRVGHQNFMKVCLLQTLCFSLCVLFFRCLLVFQFFVLLFLTFNSNSSFFN